MDDAGISASGYAQQLGAPKSYGSEKLSVKMPKENGMQDGVNPITGEAFSGDYRPTLITVDSHPAALPNWGVGSADLIYEMPIQADGSTRQLALFMGEYPAEGAGPGALCARADVFAPRDVGRRVLLLRLSGRAGQEQHEGLD